MDIQRIIKDYDYIFFDLDGTITDSGIGITNSVAYALAKFDIDVSDKMKLNKFIGPPLTESFEKYYGFSQEQAIIAVDYYREYYKDKGIFENLVYDGIEDLLKGLAQSGKTIVLATSKPEFFAKQILEHFNIAHYFKYIAGANMNETRTNKEEVIAYAISECNIVDKSYILMVGDREHDIFGAKKNGIDSLGVLFGYGDRAELEAAGATYIVETVAELKVLLV